MSKNMTACANCGARIRTKHRQGATEPRCHNCTTEDGTAAVALPVLDVETSDDGEESTDNDDGAGAQSTDPILMPIGGGV